MIGNYITFNVHSGDSGNVCTDRMERENNEQFFMVNGLFTIVTAISLLHMTKMNKK